MNLDFARYLHKRSKAVKKARQAPPVYPHHAAARRRVRERLGEQNFADLIAAFKVGVPSQALADQYAINLESVKQLLREAGVKKRSRYELLP